MRIIFILLIFSISIILAINLSAQNNNGLKGNTKRGQKEIIKRQQEAARKEAEANPFAVMPKSGRSGVEARDDLLWRAESGNTVYPGSGNISFIEPSRYGITDGLELESYLSICRWVPNAFIKKRWAEGKWCVASRHGLYTATPGYRYFHDRGNTTFARDTTLIPWIAATKNQLIFSRTYRDYMGCQGSRPYLIISFGVGVDAGIPLSDNELTETPKHFLVNRSMALAGLGYAAHLFVRGDYQLNPAWVFSGSLKYFRGNFSGHNAFEQQFTAEGFVTNNISMSLGVALSEASYNSLSTVGIAPIVDLCWYFGNKKGREIGLFDKSFKFEHKKALKYRPR